jgi:DnaK suppressor protein
MKTPTSNHPVEIPPQWRTHYRTLLRLREDLVREQEDRRAALRAPIDRGGMDEGDTAANRVERNDLVAELYAERAELAEVDAALERIRQGTYGRCEATGEEISAARLEAIPWTRLSHAAAARRDAARATTR